MNIWIFNQYAITPDLPGGTRHYDLAQELVRRGHQVVIIATSFHHYMHKETRLKAGENWKVEGVNSVKFVWLRTPPYQRNDWRRVWNMVVFTLRTWWIGRKLVRKVPEIGKPDVVVGSSPHLLTPLAAYWVARHYRVPFVMEVRDLWPQTMIDVGELGEQHTIIGVLQDLEKFLYHRAKRIITLGPQMSEYITALGVSPEKIVWIPNGVDLSRFDCAVSTELDHEGFQVMYLGAHGQADALDVLIQAAKVVQDKGFSEIRFVLVGDGPEKPRLIALAKELELHNVEFHAPVPKSKVPRTLHEADAFVLNLERAGVFRYGVSSNKLFDCMTAARPVIFAVESSNNPIEEAQCGLAVPPRDPEALAEAVIRLYKMPEEERKAMGRRGREYVEKYHAVPILADKLIQCIEGITIRGTERKMVS